MNNSNFISKNKKIIIIVVIIVFLIILAIYFSSKSKSSSNEEASLESEVTDGITSTTLSDEEIKKDTAFLSTLLSLDKITIDVTLFSDESFKSLENNNVKIEKSEIIGRPNPFIEFNQNLKAETETPLLDILEPATKVNTVIPKTKK
jgi:transcriptional/translational regulatory protein YebC/TACO1